MSESKPQWTPGDWRLADTSIVTDEHCIAVLEDDGDYAVESSEEMTANAHLIAAAPDEDAALLKAVEWGERYGEERAMAADMGIGEWEAFVPPWWHEAKAALAKARGEEAPK